MKRPDANRLGLRAVRAILDAAHDFQFSFAGREISVEVKTPPQPSWPQPLEGLDESVDGPWPAAIDVDLDWGGGSVGLRISVGYWRTKDPVYRHLVGLRVCPAGSRREVTWVTVAKYIDDAEDGQSVSLAGYCALNARKGEDWETEGARYNQRLGALLGASGLPRLSERRVDLGRVTVPQVEVLPSAQETFERLVILSHIKLPFQTRSDGQAWTGQPAFDLQLPELTTAAKVEQPDPKRLSGVHGLPGGLTRYVATMTEILDWLSAGSRSIREHQELMADRYDAHNKSYVYSCRRTLARLGVLESTGAGLEITEAGRALLLDPSPDRVFELLHARFTGFLEVLVCIDAGIWHPKEVTDALVALMGVDWKTSTQALVRSAWLRSAALVERRATGDVLTDDGARILTQHEEDAEELRARLHEHLADLTETDGDEGDEPLDEDELACDSAGWMSDRLDLAEADVQPHLGALRLPSNTIASCCAALSSGKHLLLVGPPGTGKTELALALARAAGAQGYTNGAFTSTANADWTTFDTIGGYALQKDGSLEFRPGVFLRALEQRQWLVIDELNRADIDQSFGELMTVLSGKGTETSFLDARGKPISVGPEDTRTHVVPRTFRVVATMNTWDKTSLFRLSYAVQRRFAIVHVGIPAPETYSALVRHECLRPAVDPPLEPAAADRLVFLFSPAGLLEHRRVGPAVALDMVRYMRRRQAQGDGLAEAIALMLLPQLEGLDRVPALETWTALARAIDGWTAEAALEELRSRFAELFPQVSPDKLRTA